MANIRNVEREVMEIWKDPVGYGVGGRGRGGLVQRPFSLAFERAMI